jgi:hypothetical protein
MSEQQKKDGMKRKKRKYGAPIQSAKRNPLFRGGRKALFSFTLSGFTF